MRIPTGYYPIRKKEITFDGFSGINMLPSGGPSEFLRAENVSGAKFPFLCQRPHRKLVRAIQKPNGALYFKGKLYYADGGKFYEDGAEKGTLSDGKKSIVEFNQRILVFPDLKAYDPEAKTFVPFTAAGRKIEAAAVHNNRVFGISGSNIYACKQGDYTKWDAFAGLNTDSWAADVAGAVEFRSICAYQDHIVVQSNQNLFELWGTKPSNFQVREVNKVGTVSNFVEHRSRLYFVGTSGLYEYTGGVPRLVTPGIPGTFSSGTVGYSDDCIYFTASHNGVRRTYAYDTVRHIVTEELGLDLVCFAYHNERGTMFCSDGKVLIHSEEKENIPIPWLVETRPLRLEGFKKNYGIRLAFDVELSPSSAIEVHIKNRLGHYEYLRNIEFSSSGISIVPMISGLDEVQIKLIGRGDFLLKAIRFTGIGGVVL